MSRYRIIDEPKPKPQDYLIVNPIVILLLGMILPLFWQPPLYGRMWGPLLWAIVNGYLLGSPWLKYEILIAIGGAALWLSLPYAALLAMSVFGQAHAFESAIPYVRIANQGVFFLTLYLMVLKQMLSYEIYAYRRENH